MRPERFVISDRSWAIIQPLVPGTARSCGVTAKDTRLFLEAVLWKVRVGGPFSAALRLPVHCRQVMHSMTEKGKAWRDLPPGFGSWNSIFRRFRRWTQLGVFERIFQATSADADFEYVLIDGTIISAHQKASGAKGGLSIRPSTAPLGHALHGLSATGRQAKAPPRGAVPKVG